MPASKTDDETEKGAKEGERIGERARTGVRRGMRSKVWPNGSWPRGGGIASQGDTLRFSGMGNAFCCTAYLQVHKNLDNNLIRGQG